MKYYSEKLNKLFETEKELISAEKAHDDEVANQKKAKEAAAAERKARAAEVEKAREAKNEACKHYNEVLEAFLKDYGSYHQTIRTSEDYDWIFDNDILVKFFGL
jgi:Skp family chaperone for outer membrane proteins